VNSGKRRRQVQWPRRSPSRLGGVDDFQALFPRDLRTDRAVRDRNRRL